MLSEFVLFFLQLGDETRRKSKASNQEGKLRYSLLDRRGLLLRVAMNKECQREYDRDANNLEG